MVALFRRPGLVHLLPDNFREDIEKGDANVARKREIVLPILRLKIVIKNATNAARLISVRNKEVLVAPFGKSRIVACIMFIAGRLQCRVELSLFIVVGINRRQIRSATKPLLRCGDVPCVHMYCWNEWRLHVGNERNATGPKLAIIGSAGNLLSVLLRKCAVYR